MSLTDQVLSSRLPIVWIVVVAAAYVGGVLIAPELMLWLTSHEGPIEHVGHAVLAAALVAWAQAFLVHKDQGRARTVVAAVTFVYLLFLFFEEIDWGRVYDLSLGHQWFEQLRGKPNLHSLNDEPKYGWQEPHFFMAIPWLVFFGLGLAAPSRVREALGPIRPNREAAIAFFLAGVLYMATDGIQPEGASSGINMGTFQLAVYGIVLLVGLRGARPSS